MLEICLTSVSSVGFHHGGAERGLHRGPGQWAFKAVPPPGQERTMF